jgi:hypothetical protein
LATKKIIDTTGVQISTSDPDSRQIMTRNNIPKYHTVQTTVDALHNILLIKESNLLKQYPKALRCYFAVSSCYFKLF